MAWRNLCSMVHAVSYLFNPSTRCNPNALAPFFWVVTHHMARNQTGNGVRVSWKMVPAVTDVWPPHTAHSSRTPRTGQDLPPPQRGHRKPSGYRRRAKYARQDSSVAKAASNSVRFLGYSSTMPAYYLLGLPESSRYLPPAIYASAFPAFPPILPKIAVLVVTYRKRRSPLLVGVNAPAKHPGGKHDDPKRKPSKGRPRAFGEAGAPTRSECEFGACRTGGHRKSRIV